MSENDRKVNQGFGYVASAIRSIQQEDQTNARSFLNLTKEIMDKYPKESKSLQIKYEEAKTLFEGKFGGLEESVQ